jgi:hypothetical protein
MKDKVEPSEQTDASVTYGPNRISADDLHVHGHFDLQCVGPVEDRRAEYVALRTAIAEAEAVGDDESAAQYRAQLSAIPTEEKWRDGIDNLVTTVGKNDLLDKYLLGSGYTQTFRMGLAGAGTKAAGDTQVSHAGWLEVGLANAPTYTGNRKSVTMGAAAAGVSTSPTQSFAMTSSGTVAGCFTNNGGSATKDDTTGVLFSAGDFSGGSKTVTNGDTINVTYSLSV